MTVAAVSIYVESFNRSPRLFQRLGFTGASETGAQHPDDVAARWNRGRLCR